MHETEPLFCNSAVAFGSQMQTRAEVGKRVRRRASAAAMASCYGKMQSPTMAQILDSLTILESTALTQKAKRDNVQCTHFNRMEVPLPKFTEDKQSLFVSRTRPRMTPSRTSTTGWSPQFALYENSSNLRTDERIKIFNFHIQ
jgi:hypothetical protein